MEGKQGVNNSLNLKSMKFQKALLIVLIDNQWQPKHLTKKKKSYIKLLLRTYPYCMISCYNVEIVAPIVSQATCI